MWNDFTIGSGDKLNSAINIGLPIKSSVSQNSKSYWIVYTELGSGFSILKNTIEGIKLSRLIENKEYEIIDDYLLDLVIKNIPLNKFKELFEEKIHESYLKGRLSKIKEFKAFLAE